MKENISKGLGSLDNSQAMNLTSTLIQQTQILNSGYDYNETRRNNGERIRLYNQILEENILNRMKNGIMGANVKLGRNEDFYSMIQARNWANESVHLVFIPAEQVAYYAYDYDENGMGKSLLDGVTQTSTLRIMTNFANFMAAVNNAVGRTKVAINIDPRTPDPEKAATIMTDEYLRTQAGASPTDVTSASRCSVPCVRWASCLKSRDILGYRTPPSMSSRSPPTVHRLTSRSQMPCAMSSTWAFT